MNPKNLITTVLAIMILLLPGRLDAAIRLLAVGIADYPGTSRDLSLPANDARMIKTLYDKIPGTTTTLLLNENAMGSTCPTVRTCCLPWQ